MAEDSGSSGGRFESDPREFDDEPAAGTSQVVTINGTDGSYNASGVTYLVLVISTPT